MKLVAVLSMALVACGDPILHVKGVVRNAPDACSTVQGNVYDSARPIAGASASLSCPGAPARPLGTTDEAGRFEYVAVGGFGKPCSIVIQKEGYQVQTFQVAEICSVEFGGLCQMLSMQADLAPAVKR